MSEKFFKFYVENMRTGEKTDFIGQGETMAVAWSDAVKLVNEHFRPSSSGKKTNPHGVHVMTKDGRSVHRTLQEFESDFGHGQKPQPTAIPEEESFSL